MTQAIEPETPEVTAVPEVPGTLFTAAPSAPFTVHEALTRGWAFTSEHLSTLVIATCLILITAIGGSQLLSRISNRKLELFASVVLYAIVAMFMQGYLRLALGAVDGDAPDLKTLFNLYSLPEYLITVIGMIFALVFGSILFILPGLAIWYFLSLAAFLVADRGLGPVEAWRSSFRLVSRGSGLVARLWLTTAGLYLLGMLAFGVGFLVAVPVCTVAAAHVYRHLASTVES